MSETITIKIAEYNRLIENGFTCKQLVHLLSLKAERNESIYSHEVATICDSLGITYKKEN